MAGVRKGAKGGAKGAGEGEEKRGEGALEWGKSFLLAIVLFLFLRIFVLGTFVITSGSMERTLLVGDFVVVNRMALGARIPYTTKHLPGWAEPKIGDILVFDPHHEPDLKLVKRLVGMEGDLLEMREGTLFRNGEAMEESAYVEHRDPNGNLGHPWMAWQAEHLAPGVDPDSYVPVRDTWGPLLIPEGHLFLLGDNRDESLDSRYWGLIEEWRVEGRASFIYYSYDRDSREAFPFFRSVRWDRIFDPIR